MGVLIYNKLSVFEDFFKDDGAINEEVLKNFLTVLVPAEAPAQE